jgi:hypothetical protein
LLLLVTGLVGCGRQDLDLLLRAEREDPCLSIDTEQACRDSASLGCSYQPNLVGCVSTDPACLPGTCRSGDPFVRRVERSFFLASDPFRFAGVSSWALLPGTTCSRVKPEARKAWITNAYDGLVPARVKVARFFAFQSAAGSSGDDFSLIDASVHSARRAGVRLQLVLEHAEGACSVGKRRDDAWYSGGYKSPDGSYALSYRDYAEAVARRYRDEPTVLGYALMQSTGYASADAVSGFVKDMGQLLHGVAPNQLLSLDLAWDSVGDDGVAYREIQEQPVVDFVDTDDYAFAEPLEPLNENLLATLAQLNKPTIIGEGAFKLSGDDDEAFQRRAEKARARMADWKEWGFDGALFWAYQPGWGAVSEEFDTRPADPMLAADGVIANAPW